MAMSSGNLNQVRVTWTGFTGAPGISTFYYPTGSVPPSAAIRTFFSALTGFIPNTVNIQVPTDGEVIQSTDGQLVTTWSGGAAPAVVTGGLTSNALSAQGFQVVWGTNEVADGRAVKGRTFIVPSGGAAFDGAGTLSTGTTATVTAAATALMGATPQMAVWHRPKRDPDHTGPGPAPIIRPGSYALVTTGTAMRKAVVLTSRRD